MHEDRRFPPPADLAASANVTADTYAEAEADFEGFWAKQAERLSWDTKPTETLDWSNPPFAKWYADGTLNAAYNCLDRHVEAGNGDRVAFYFEGEPGDTRDDHVRGADHGGQAGGQCADRAGGEGRRPGRDLSADDPRGCGRDTRLCADRRAAHGGLRRLLRRRAVHPHPDCGVEVVITADGGYRRGAPSALKPAVDAALERARTSAHVLVIKPDQAGHRHDARAGTCGGTSSSAKQSDRS